MSPTEVHWTLGLCDISGIFHTIAFFPSDGILLSAPAPVAQTVETVEKPLVLKMFKKISHNRLKKYQNIAKMLCGTPKTRCFSAFLSHFSKFIFEK